MGARRQPLGNQGGEPGFASPCSAVFPADPGGYALLIRLSRPFSGEIGALGPIELPVGHYLYLGSARGPGGLRARIGRHLRPAKRPHWHVDALTAAGTVDKVLAVPGGSECDLVARFQALPGVTVPLPGFGSTDCRRCAAHLLAVADTGAAVPARPFSLARSIDGGRAGVSPVILRVQSTNR